jgi:hypothetical protein
LLSSAIRSTVHAKNLTDSHKIRVEQAFARWRDRRQLLQDTSQALEQALEAFARRSAPEPVQLKAHLEELRSQCDALFLEVLAATSAARAARAK